VQEGQREQDTFEILLDACQLFALENDIFYDKTINQKGQRLTSSNRTGEDSRIVLAIDSETLTHNTRRRVWPLEKLAQTSGKTTY
jgi:hypothetical protein